MIMDITKIDFISPSIAVDIPEIDLFWCFYLGASKDREYNRWTRKCGSISYCP